DVVLTMILYAPTSPLFPYTTLFRSCRAYRTSDVGVNRCHRCNHHHRVECTRCQTGIHRPKLHGVFLTSGRGVDDLRFGDSWRRSEEHTSELQSRFDLVCRLLLAKKKWAQTWV